MRGSVVRAGFVGWFAAGFAALVGCGAEVAPAAGEGAPDATRDDVIVAPSPEDAGAASVEGEAEAAAPRPAACEASSPRPGAVKVAVLPDDGEAAYLAVLATATRSVRVYGYQMGYGGVLDTLVAKARAGVAVRVILDGATQLDVNEKYRVALEGAGAQVLWGDTAFSYMHAKVIVVDDRLATVSTGNYARSFMLKERNYVAQLDDADDVADLAALFDADWGRRTPDLSCTRLLVSPENAKPRLLAAVGAARRTVQVESMQLSERDVVDALLARKAAGVDVRVVLADPSWIDANAAAGQRLKDAGVDVRWLKSPGVHAKVFVIDGQAAVLGSQNMSFTSLAKNREVGLWIDDPAAVARMGATFEADRAQATAF